MRSFPVFLLLGLLGPAAVWAAPPSIEEVRTACETPHAAACESYGLALVKGWHWGVQVEQDVARGLEVLGTACEGGAMSACSTLGQILYAGSYEIVADLTADESDMAAPKDRPRAVSLHQKACEGGEAMSCLLLAELYEKGETLERDYTKAMALYEKVCATDELACTALARVRALSSSGALKVSVGDVSLMGDVEQSALDAAVVGVLGSVDTCYATLLSTAPSRAGDVTVSFQLRSGALVSPKIKGSTLGDASVEQCVLKAIEGLDASAFDTAMTMASYTLVFAPLP